MRVTRKRIYTTLFISLLLMFILLYDLPYYGYQPGHADAISPMLTVEDAYEAEGEFHLVTVSGMQLSLLQLVIAKWRPYYEVVPLEEVRPDGISDDEYMHYQLMLMDGSKHAAMVVAFEAANKKVEKIDNGVYVVRIVQGMPAEGKLEMGDRITQIDDRKITRSDQLVDYVKGKKAGDLLQIKAVRDEVEIEVEIAVQEFPDEEEVGIGIQLVTDQDITTEQAVEVDSGKIGGPSAGLMFALTLYNQLVEEDITKGYQIAGTGEIDESGAVKRIGGVDKKVVAADKAGMDIFFVPNEAGRAGSNYEVAKETAKDIGTDMEIVAVDTFEEALAYLEALD